MTMTTTLTRSPYPGESTHLAAIPGWHGLFGHLNVVTPDHKRKCTGYGKHDRVVVFHPDASGLYCRVDHIWSLGEPTEAQILAVARSNDGCNLRGRWKLQSKQVWADGSSTDYHFTRT